MLYIIVKTASKLPAVSVCDEGRDLLHLYYVNSEYLAHKPEDLNRLYKANKEWQLKNLFFVGITTNRTLLLW